jgi:hypothetical protein
MKVNVEVSNYIKGRYNNQKLDKLKAQLEKNFANYKERSGQSIPELGLLIKISMSAKYQTPYVMVENWGGYEAIGDIENIVLDSLTERGFEQTGVDAEEDWFQFDFE